MQRAHRLGNAQIQLIDQPDALEWAQIRITVIPRHLANGRAPEFASPKGSADRAGFVDERQKVFKRNIPFERVGW
jgi:hypothetical protein